MPDENNGEVPRSLSSGGGPFVFQDSASDRSSEYQAGSEASSSVRRILTSRTNAHAQHVGKTSNRQQSPGTPNTVKSEPSHQVFTKRYTPREPPIGSNTDEQDSFEYQHSFLPRGRSGLAPSHTSGSAGGEQLKNHHRSHSFPLLPNLHSSSKQRHRSPSQVLSPSSVGDVSSITSNSASAFTRTSSDISSSFYAESSSKALSPLRDNNKRLLQPNNTSALLKPKPRWHNHLKEQQEAIDTSDASNHHLGGILQEREADVSDLTSESAESATLKYKGETTIGADTKENSSNNHNNMAPAPSAWNFAPAVSCIPEEQDQAERAKPSLPQQDARAAIANGKTQDYKSSSATLSPTKSTITTVCSAPSPQSQRSLACSSVHNMDNSSFAGTSMASGFQSEGTGFQSDATLIIRNGTGPRRIPGDASDVETGGSSIYPLPIRSLPLPPLRLIPSGRELHLPPPTIDEHNKKRRKKKHKLCGGTQGLIIGLLVALFVFGVITVVVSFILSRRKSKGGNAPLVTIGTANDDDVGVYGGNQIKDDDNLYPETNDTLPSIMVGDFLESTDAVTTSPSEELNQEDTLFADAVEELILNAVPTISPTVALPSSVPSFATVSSNLPSEVPQSSIASFATTGTPSGAPTMLPTPSPTTRDPTLAPTTVNPTPLPAQIAPLLHPNVTLHQEAQVWGEGEGDAAGSSLALSGNGGVLFVGAPNAGSANEELERVGLVRVYERRQKASTSNGGVGWEWTQKGIIRGEQSMNQLGFSLATNYDGSIVVVSQPTADSRRGKVIIYEWQPASNVRNEDSGEYQPMQVLEGDQTTDHFGIAVSIANGDGDRYPRLAIGSPYYSSKAVPGQSASNLRGQVRVYEYSEKKSEYEPMKAIGGDTFLLGNSSLDWFGWSVSLSQDGEFLAVGAPRNTEFGGYVQCFRYNENVWSPMGSPIWNLIDPVKLDDRWGHAISLSTTGTRTNGDLSPVVRLAIGAPWKDTGNVLNSGMVAVFEWSEVNMSWLLDTNGALGGILDEDQPGFYHQFGYSLQMQGDAVVVGVPGWENRRGLVNIYWLNHAFSSELDGSGSTWENLTTPLNGEAEGDDFGFSVCLSMQTITEQSQKPSSLIVAAGAIMVSGTPAEDAGYSKVFQVGDSP